MDRQRRAGAANVSRSSPGGIALALPAVRVRMTVWAISGMVSSFPNAAAAAA